MKKLKLITTFLLVILVLGMVGCSAGGNEESKENKDSAAAELPKNKDGKQIVTIGTSSISKDVLEVAQKVFNESNEDYVVEVQVFDDAVTPNIATEDGSIQGTFHQYESYMDNFNKDRNASLKTVGKEIFAFQIGLYSNKITDISQIKDGMTVAVANDASNRAIALNLLADEGIITIKDGVTAPTVLDVAENPHNLKFVEMERLNLANAVDDTDMAVVMSDVMKEAGRDAGAALAYAQEEGIQLVIKEEGPWTAALEEALASKEVKTYIVEETDKTKLALF